MHTITSLCEKPYEHSETLKMKFFSNWLYVVLYDYSVSYGYSVMRLCGLAKRYKRKIMAPTRTTYGILCEAYARILDFSKIFAATNTFAVPAFELQIMLRRQKKKLSSK